MQIFSDLYKEERKENVILLSHTDREFYYSSFHLPENYLIHLSVQELLSDSALAQPIALKFF